MTNRAGRLILKLSAALMIMATHTGTLLAACNFSVQGKGRVTSIIDARTFRLDDGREVRLGGIETDAGEKLAAGSRKLETLIGGRDVTLRGQRRQARSLWPRGRGRVSGRLRNLDPDRTVVPG